MSYNFHDCRIRRVLLLRLQLTEDPAALGRDAVWGRKGGAILAERLTPPDMEHILEQRRVPLVRHPVAVKLREGRNRIP